MQSGKGQTLLNFFKRVEPASSSPSNAREVGRTPKSVEATDNKNSDDETESRIRISETIVDECTSSGAVKSQQQERHAATKRARPKKPEECASTVHPENGNETASGPPERHSVAAGE